MVFTFHYLIVNLYLIRRKEGEICDVLIRFET